MVGEAAQPKWERLKFCLQEVRHCIALGITRWQKLKHGIERSGVHKDQSLARFTPDFTSSWVIRELTLVTAAGLEFHFTLNVTLPHHLLPLCADVVPGPSWEESFWRLTVFFVR